MTSPADPSAPSLLPKLRARLPWIPAAVVLGGGWVLADSLHGPWSGALTVAAAAGGWWWLGRGRRTITPRLPATWTGWIERCEGLLDQFERLEGSAATAPTPPAPTTQAQLERRLRLDQLRQRQQRRELQVGLAGVTLPDPSLQPDLVAALRAPLPLALHWGHPLPAHSTDWRWPRLFEQCDLLLVWLETPLRAADLRWLETLPQQQPVGLLVRFDPASPGEILEKELRAQLPVALADRLIVWSGRPEDLGEALDPVGRTLRSAGRQQLLQTELRCLESLHADWQGILEGLRRQRLRGLLQRTQWLVAAGVFAAPLPSLDLLVLAVANGLMLQEMARLWDCPWGLEPLREAATELARAALALGVTEWTSQSLLALMRLEGSTWLIGGSLQALSAAYLTRVVGQAMADVLALSSGVPAADLAEVRRQAPLLVARAAAAEKLDWAGFITQGKQWLQGRQPPGGVTLSSPC